MAAEISYFLSGAALGASAGLSPGPLQALVISETLRHGRGAGIRASFAPLLTDLPIILVSAGLLSEMAGLDAVMGCVSIGGALFVARLACGNLKSAESGGSVPSAAPASLKKAVITNFLNPHPYLFWIFVGAPTILAAARQGAPAAVAFVAGFYSVLLGIFILLAAGAARSRRWVHGRVYRWVMRGLAGVLALFALLLLYKGLNLFAIL